MAGLFKALGDPTRLQLISLLATDTTGKLGVSDLAQRLGVSQPAVSQHLKTLRGEGLVVSRREGFYVYYTLNRERMVTFREQFNLMYASVMDKCDMDLIRRATQQPSLNICTICYSYTGITRSIADKVQRSCGGELIEVKTREPYSTFTAYTKGVLRSRQEKCDPITPDIIDVSSFDLLVLGTPVWAWKPAPAIHAVVDALAGCDGKNAVIFTTCLKEPGEGLSILKKKLENRGVRVCGAVSLTKKEIDDMQKDNELITEIVSAYPRKNHDGAGPEPEKTKEGPV